MSALAERHASVGAMLLAQVAASGAREAFRYPEGDRWTSLSWNDTKDRVFAAAAGLLAHGLGREERVAIAAGTRIEWVLADLAIMCAGGATTTVYPTTQHADVAFILADSDAKIVITEDAEQTAKVIDHLDELPQLRAIVQLDGTTSHELVSTWADLLRQGEEHLAAHPNSVDEAIASVDAQTLSTLIYTSGTTGRPKGVRLLHDSWTYLGAAIEDFGIITPQDLQYLWLPLSHVFGKALIAIQLRIGFATAIDGRIDTIVDNLGVVRPTFMAGAPRIFEKVRAKVMMGAAHGAKAKIFDWAFSVGHKTVAIRTAGQQPKGALAVQYALADALVFSKIKARMGGRIKFFVSGSAALNREVQEWFYAAGLLVLEGYGLTETSAASFVNDPTKTRFGTVGPPVPGTEVRIAADGEVLIKGAGVMQGYHHNDAATAEVLTADGWFSTGDLGELDEAGYLKITDRKKDLIKTSGGKYVAPQKVEGALKATCPYASQVVAYGEGRKYVTALITLDPDAIKEWASTSSAAGAVGESSYADLATSAAVHAMITDYVEQANRKLERWETVKRFVILPEELTVEEGEVTPSQKVRRGQVTKRYAAELDALYDKD